MNRNQVFSLSKQLLVLAAAGAAGLTLAHGQAPKSDPRPVHLDFTNVGRASVGLDVKETAASKAVAHNWETDYGSYDRDFARSRTLGITISNLGQKAVSEAKIEVLWFAQRPLDREAFIFSRQIKEADLSAGRGKVIEFNMPLLKSNVTNFAGTGERWVSGSKYAGYIVLIRDGEKVLDAKTATPSLQQLTRTPEKFDPMLVKAEKLKRTDE
jgi:hypothetical protein